MDPGPDLVPLCIVGARGARPRLYAQALRRLGGAGYGLRSEGGGIDLRVTCVCDADADARAGLKRVLCGEQPRLPAAAEDLDAIAEYESLDEVLVCEEFGDFLCSAVLVLLDTPDRAVTVAVEAINKGKHVFLEPWAPALTTAMRWGGVDDAFRKLWEVLRSADERAVCVLAHPLEACARRFAAWLESESRSRDLRTSEGRVGTSAVLSATVLRPPRPDPISSRALGLVGAEQTAWIRPLRFWLGDGINAAPEGQSSADPPSGHGCSVEPEPLKALPGPGSGLCSVVHSGSGAGAVVSWVETDAPETEEALELGDPALCVRYSLAGPMSVATLSVRLARRDGLAGNAEGALLHGGDGGGVNLGAAAATGVQKHFACDEVDALADELQSFARRIVFVQSGVPAATNVGPVALDACDRATYAGMLQALGVRADS